MQKPEKILFIINHPEWFWSHRLPLAQGAKKQGWDVLVAVRDATKDPRFTTEGFKPLDLPQEQKGKTFTNVINIIKKTNRLFSEEKPDVVHAITLKYVFLTGIVARFHPKIRAIYTIAGLGYLFSSDGIKPKILRILIGPFLKFCLKNKQARIIFQNPDDQRLMINKKFVRADQTYLIKGSGVDTVQFYPQTPPQENPPIVLMPTRLVYDKGIQVFIEAARIIKKRKLVEARFQIAGGITEQNPNAITLEAMKSLIADGSVEWLGKVDDMSSLLSKAQVIAYPSYYGEGVPKVLLEAASCGKAIVTTDHPGCREVVVHNFNGLLVPIRDSKATADAIEKLLINHALRIQMEKNSRQRAEKEFDVKIVVSETLKIYAIT